MKRARSPLRTRATARRRIPARRALIQRALHPGDALDADRAVSALGGARRNAADLALGSKVLNPKCTMARLTRARTIASLKKVKCI